jgi:hypothetical protein
MMTTDSHEGNYLQTHRKQAGDFAKTVVLARVSRDIDPPDSVIGGWTKSPRFARQAIIEISEMLGQAGAPNALASNARSSVSCSENRNDATKSF